MTALTIRLFTLVEILKKKSFYTYECDNIYSIKDDSYIIHEDELYALGKVYNAILDDDDDICIFLENDNSINFNIAELGNNVPFEILDSVVLDTE